MRLSPLPLVVSMGAKGSPRPPTRFEDFYLSFLGSGGAHTYQAPAFIGKPDFPMHPYFGSSAEAPYEP